MAKRARPRLNESNDTLRTQASNTAENYLHEAKEAIDILFGEGHAAKHPELVSGFMYAASQDLNANQLKSGLEDVKKGLKDISRAIEQLDRRK